MAALNLVVNWIKEIGWQRFVDLAIITLVFYSLLVWLKRARRAITVLAGILIVAAV